VETVDHPHFGLLLDIWQDPGAEARIRTLGGKIFGVHVTDWRTLRSFGGRHLPDKGEITIVRLLKAIRETGYDGAYTLELFSELQLESSYWADPRRTVVEGRDAFEEIWRQVCA
jgi:sugar phosphate isomerase/epimerase